MGNFFSFFCGYFVQFYKVGERNMDKCSSLNRLSTFLLY